jgi:hypothetical protein
MQNWYTSLPGHDYFCDVHEDFIEDDFNLTGTSTYLTLHVPFNLYSFLSNLASNLAQYQGSSANK